MPPEARGEPYGPGGNQCSRRMCRADAALSFSCGAGEAGVRRPMSPSANGWTRTARPLASSPLLPVAPSSRPYLPGWIWCGPDAQRPGGPLASSASSLAVGRSVSVLNSVPTEECLSESLRPRLTLDGDFTALASANLRVCLPGDCGTAVRKARVRPSRTSSGVGLLQSERYSVQVGPPKLAGARWPRVETHHEAIGRERWPYTRHLPVATRAATSSS